MVVPTQILKDQWIEQIDTRGVSLNVDVIIVNTVIKNKYECDLLIVDEVHLTMAQTFSQVFQAVSYRYILCLTGTLERLDMRHLLLDKYAPVCDKITLGEAEDNGWVSPHKEYVVMLDVDLTEYKELTKKFNSYFSYMNYDFELGMRLATNPIERNKWSKKMGLDSKKTAAIAMDWMRCMKKRKDFILNHPKKVEIAKKIMAARPNSKGITFSATIKQAESLGPGWVMHSKKKLKENQQAIEEFNNASCGMLHTSKAADQGLDCKGVNLEIILHTDSSKIRKNQRVGRAVRFEEGKTSEIFTLILRGTQEVNWFSNSKTTNVITINEEQLDKVLNGENIVTREREYTPNITLRF